MTDNIEPPLPDVQIQEPSAESVSHVIPPESEWPAEGAPVDEEAAARYDGQ